MKTFILRLLTSSMMILVLTACGKDKDKSGSDSSSSNPYNLPYNGLMPNVPNAQTAYSNLRSWYTSNVEGANPANGNVLEIRQVLTYSGNNGCKTKDISIFGLNFGSFSTCFGGYTAPVETRPSRTVLVTRPYTKSTNVKLAQALSGIDANGNAMQLANVTQSQQFGGGTFTLEWMNYQTGHRKVYTIDASLHSAFNPIQVIDTQANTTERVIEIRPTF